MAENKTNDWDNPDFIQGHIESRKFLRANPDYPVNQRNADTFQRELGNRNLAWTAINLQTVWDEIDKDLIDYTTDLREEAKPAIEISVEETPIEKFPWGLRLEGAVGKARVSAMSRDEYRGYLSNKRTGDEFRNQVEALGFVEHASTH